MFVFGIPSPIVYLYALAYFFYYPVFEFYIYVNWATESGIESEVLYVFMLNCVAEECARVCVCVSEAAYRVLVGCCYHHLSYVHVTIVSSETIYALLDRDHVQLSLTMRINCGIAI